VDHPCPSVGQAKGQQPTSYIDNGNVEGNLNLTWENRMLKIMKSRKRKREERTMNEGEGNSKRSEQ